MIFFLDFSTLIPFINSSIGNLNKSLLPLGSISVISHILNKFPEDSEFIIGVGYLKDQVKCYLQIAHSNLNFKFVEIDNFENE